VNFLIILSFVLCSFMSAAQNKPNILIIHVDDLGYHDLSIHGSKIYQTPNIDRLATESVSFTNAYANYPRCVPSRFSMMTGNYPIQNRRVPTRYELAQMYSLKTDIEAVGDSFGTKTYWTSNQSVYSVNGLSEETAWRQNFGTGLQYDNNNILLDGELFVRSVREF